MKPGHVVLSRRRDSFSSHPVQATFQRLVELVQRREIGDDGIYLEANHVRVFVGFAFSASGSRVPWLFHWGGVSAGFEVGRDWMLDMDYAAVFGYTGGPVDSDTLFSSAMSRSTEVYDGGGLIDVMLGYDADVFTLGEGSNFCSSGAAALIEDALCVGKGSPPESSSVSGVFKDEWLRRRVLPATFANDSMWGGVSGASWASLREEPEEPKGLRRWAFKRDGRKCYATCPRCGNVVDAARVESGLRPTARMTCPRCMLDVSFVPVR
jgi:hypothetical protein